MPEWITLEEARRDWADAPTDDPTLLEYVQAVSELAAAYAPKPAAGETFAPGPRHKLAARLWVQDLWTATQSGGTGDTDLEDLEHGAQIASLLRPRTRPPAVG